MTVASIAEQGVLYEDSIWAQEAGLLSLTVYKTSFPVLFGLPADLRGADRSTSGVNFAARIVMVERSKQSEKRKLSCVEVETARVH